MLYESLSLGLNFNNKLNEIGKISLRFYNFENLEIVDLYHEIFLFLHKNSIFIFPNSMILSTFCKIFKNLFIFFNLFNSSLSPYIHFHYIDVAFLHNCHLFQCIRSSLSHEYFHQIFIHQMHMIFLLINVQSLIVIHFPPSLFLP